MSIYLKFTIRLKQKVAKNASWTRKEVAKNKCVTLATMARLVRGGVTLYNENTGSCESLKCEPGVARITENSRE